MKMHRILAILMAATLLFSALCACGEPTPPSTSTENGATDTEQETELTDDLPDDLKR